MCATFRTILANCRRHFSTDISPQNNSKLLLYRTKLVWDELTGVQNYVAATKLRRKREMYGTGRDELVFKMHALGRILKYRDDFREFMENRKLEKILLTQAYIQERVDILGPDLAAAFFIVHRGGCVKFWRKPDWVGVNQKCSQLPTRYTPGIFVEAINANGTNLHYEGLDNICNLSKLKWLSLKNLVNLNDFALDKISGNYGSQLEYLDLTGCTGITHYGLASFYRFKELKFLNLSGIEHSNEFKLSCIMVQDLLPELTIEGVDFSIPEQLIDDQIVLDKSNDKENNYERLMDKTVC